MKIRGARIFDRMSALSAAIGIPVADQAANILRRGSALEDAQCSHDYHWAAEALLEWLQDNPRVCAPDS